MKSLFIVAMTFGVVSLGSAYGGKVEGKVFPVVGSAQFLQMRPANAASTRFWGEFERYRHCSFERLEWYLGDDKAASRADLVFEEGAKIRGTGQEEFGPWVVQLTPDQLANRSYAVVYHRCHAFWLTETRFYG